MRIKKYTVYLILGLLFFIFIPFLVSKAQTERITLTTYYPAPYGVYRDLETRRLVVGNDNMSNVDGVVNFQGLGSNPSFTDDGALYYNSFDHEFRYYDSSRSGWVSLGNEFLVRVETHLGKGSVRVNCPAGYTRIACFGGGNLDSNGQPQDAGVEEDHGYYGVGMCSSMSDNGCCSYSDGMSTTVYALCIR